MAMVPPVISQRQASRTPTAAIAMTMSSGIPLGLLQESVLQSPTPAQMRNHTKSALASSPNIRAIQRIKVVEKFSLCGTVVMIDSLFSHLDVRQITVGWQPSLANSVFKYMRREMPLPLSCNDDGLRVRAFFLRACC